MTSLCPQILPQSTRKHAEDLHSLETLRPLRSAFAAAAQIADRGNKSLEFQTVSEIDQIPGKPLEPEWGELDKLIDLFPSFGHYHLRISKSQFFLIISNGDVEVRQIYNDLGNKWCVRGLSV